MAKAKTTTKKDAPKKENATLKAPAFDTSKFKEKVLTKPLFKFVNDVPQYIEIQGEIYTGKEIKGSSEKTVKMEPAKLCDVVNLATGEEGMIICGAVLRGVLNDNYPNNKYIGKKFKVTQYDEGKRYKNYKVSELQ